MALCNQNKTVLEFMVYGEGFPFGRQDGFMKYRSKIDQNMYVDYNDGTQPVAYKMNASSYMTLRNQKYEKTDYLDETDVDNLPNYGPLFYKGRAFQDGYNGDRLVKIRFDNYIEIDGFSSSLVQSWKGSFPVNVLKYTNIEQFYCKYAYQLEDLPEDLITLKKIYVLDFSGTFGASTREYLKKELPLGFLNLSLITLRLSNLIRLNTIIDDNLKSNLDKVHLLKDTLETLGLSSCNFGDRTMPLDIVDGIKRCNNLRNLEFDSNQYATPPSFLNEITQLELIKVGGGYSYDSYMTNWGDLSNLTNLKSLYCTIATKVPTDIPIYLKEFPHLKRFSVEGSYDTQERWDEFIENLYNYTLLFAPITNDDVNNPVGCRDYMVVNNRFSATYVVTGEYEQPFGYEQGVSNGEANTQLQKIWVLKNQYNVNVIYKDNRALDGGN